METETETKLLGATSSRRRRWTKQRLTSRRLLAKTAIAVAATRRKARPARNSGSGTAETKRRLARAYRQVEVGSRRLTRRSGRASDGGNAAQRLRSTKRNDERRLGRTLGLDANWPWAAINSRVAGRCAARGLRRPTREPEVARNKGLAGQGRARGRDAEKRAATIRKSRMRTDENARSKRPKIEREKRDGTAHGALVGQLRLELRLLGASLLVAQSLLRLRSRRCAALETRRRRWSGCGWREEERGWQTDATRREAKR